MRRTCKTYPFGSLPDPKYVVILSKFDGKLLLSRHKERTTFETQGGHIEAGETVWKAAMRELYEESGAMQYRIYALCDYRAGTKTSYGDGSVFVAEIDTMLPLPESEMAEVKTFDTLPSNDELTYPWITPTLFKAAKDMLYF